MPTRFQSVLAAVIATLVLAAAPASAVTITSGGTTASQKALSKAERRAAKQARKLAKQCAKLGTKKLKPARQAQLHALCAKPNAAAADEHANAGNSPTAENATGNQLPDGNDEDVDNGGPGGSVGDVDDDEDAAVDKEENWNDEGDLVDVTDPANAGDDDPDDLLAEILDSPPLFTPPPGGDEQVDAPLTRQSAHLNPEADDAEEPPNNVPEPGTLALLGVGLLGLGFSSRRGSGVGQGRRT